MKANGFTFTLLTLSLTILSPEKSVGEGKISSYKYRYVMIPLRASRIGKHTQLSDEWN
ncbi:MAG: hypothetical protein U0K35_05385 [Prevotella sp.]|nr:hypothetical protein [Prevotella sp.]